MDGAEQVWFGRRRGASVFDYSWETRDGIPLKLNIMGTSAPKLYKNFRCYDLIINGQIFANLPQYPGTADFGTVVPEVVDEEEAFDDGRPKSIFEIFYPNGYTVSEEYRQPEQQLPQQATIEIEQEPVEQPRVAPEPMDLLD